LFFPEKRKRRPRLLDEREKKGKVAGLGAWREEERGGSPGRVSKRTTCRKLFNRRKGEGGDRHPASLRGEGDGHPAGADDGPL